MSTPVPFHFYNKEGNFLGQRSLFTISYGARLGDLTVIRKELLRIKIEDHKKYIHEDVQYAVPMFTADYMFDLLDPKLPLLPNKFKNTIED